MKGQKISTSLIRQVFILLLIFVLGGLILSKTLPYFSGVLGAITLFVIFKKSMVKMKERNWNSNLASSIILLISTLLIVLPIFLIVYLLTSKIGQAVKNSEQLVNALKNQLSIVEDYLGYNLSSQIDASSITDWVSKSLQNLAVGTFDVFIALTIMYFLLYYMLINHKKLETTLEAYVPIGIKNFKRIGREAYQKVRANAIGIPMVALFQGIIALIGFWIFGVSNPWFWFVITAVGSILPFVGTALGIIPVSIILFADGATASGIGILIYGAVVVGASDNLIRLYILKKMSNEHPLITLIGVIIGVPLFGFIGLIFGPLLISLFLLVVKIYKEEYGEKSSIAEHEKVI
ncbi:AI-2E family transporter [Psychroflexus planctonicus]|uniref:AI-2E family transporter n=1 Tax=Psychroflexus planctonicus TaxID=1526575 RepID=A0ABQ1SIU9_9FLAO|nr:AI-2E family transporter [Psychroflexus planctonicus]GGE39018.1 AI-2E family transporter [Psychroflexus planctonicus]